MVLESFMISELEAIVAMEKVSAVPIAIAWKAAT